MNKLRSQPVFLHNFPDSLNQKNDIKQMCRIPLSGSASTKSSVTPSRWDGDSSCLEAIMIAADAQTAPPCQPTATAVQLTQSCASHPAKRPLLCRRLCAPSTQKGKIGLRNVPLPTFLSSYLQHLGTLNCKRQ